MPCDMRMARKELPEALAKQGWSPEEIALLDKEIELARQKAKAESFNAGETLTAQERRMQLAEAEARRIAHERMHAACERMMRDIREFGEAKLLPSTAQRLRDLHAT